MKPEPWKQFSDVELVVASLIGNLQAFDELETFLTVPNVDADTEDVGLAFIQFGGHFPNGLIDDEFFDPHVLVSSLPGGVSKITQAQR